MQMFLARLGENPVLSDWGAKKRGNVNCKIRSRVLDIAGRNPRWLICPADEYDSWSMEEVENGMSDQVDLMTDE